MKSGVTYANAAGLAQAEETVQSGDTEIMVWQRKEPGLFLAVTDY